MCRIQLFYSGFVGFTHKKLSPLHGFHRGWAKPETHGFQPQEPSLKPETQHETHSWILSKVPMIVALLPSHVMIRMYAGPVSWVSNYKHWL